MRTWLLGISLAAFAPLPVVAQAGPACSAPAGAVDERTSLIARLPFHANNNHVYLRVCHESSALDFILDTGAPSSFFDLNTARDRGVRLGAAFRASGAGAGTVPGAFLEATSVRLAGTAIDWRIAAAIDFSGVTPREGHRLEGVLGGDFVERYVVRIDYANRTVELHDRDRFRAATGVVIPMIIRTREPHIDIEVAFADGTRVPAHMLIDVGGSGPFSFRKDWVDEHGVRGRVRPTQRIHGGSGVGGATVADAGRAPAIRIGELTIDAPIVHLYGDSTGYFSESGPVDGTIGGDVLRRYIVTFDYARRQVIFEPHDGEVTPFEANMTGVTFGMDSALTSIVVQHVMEGSPAAEAGLQEGDTIVAVNGEPADAAVLERLRERVRTEGERIELTVRRGTTEERRVVVTRRAI